MGGKAAKERRRLQRLALQKEGSGSAEKANEKSQSTLTKKKNNVSASSSSEQRQSNKKRKVIDVEQMSRENQSHKQPFRNNKSRRFNDQDDVSAFRKKKHQHGFDRNDRERSRFNPKKSSPIKEKAETNKKLKKKINKPKHLKRKLAQAKDSNDRNKVLRDIETFEKTKKEKNKELAETRNEGNADDETSIQTSIEKLHIKLKDADIVQRVTIKKQIYQLEKKLQNVIDNDTKKQDSQSANEEEGISDDDPNDNSDSKSDDTDDCNENDNESVTSPNDGESKENNSNTNNHASTNLAPEQTVAVNKSLTTKGKGNDTTYLVKDNASDNDDDSDVESDIQDSTKRQRGRRRRGRKGREKPDDNSDHASCIKDSTNLSSNVSDKFQVEKPPKKEKLEEEKSFVQTDNNGKKDGRNSDQEDKRYCIGRKPVTDYEVGKSYKGKVIYMKPFGLFVDIGCHSDAFVHVSRLDDNYVENPESLYKIGDVIPNVRIIEISRSKKQITASLQSNSRLDDEIKSIQDKKLRSEKRKQQKPSTSSHNHSRHSGVNDNDAKESQTSHQTIRVEETHTVTSNNENSNNNNTTTNVSTDKKINYNSNVPIVIDESRMTHAELKRARKLARRAERRAQKELTGISA